MKEKKFLFYDTERSGNEHLVSIGFVVTDSAGNILEEWYNILKPYKPISRASIAIHGITTDVARKNGIVLAKALNAFNRALRGCDVVGCYSASGDLCSISLACKHAKVPLVFDKGTSTVVDVAQMAMEYMWAIDPESFGKTPSLETLYASLFPSREFSPHNALEDAKATAECFFRLMDLGFLSFSSILTYAKVQSRCHPAPKKKLPAANNAPNEDTEHKSQ